MLPVVLIGLELGTIVIMEKVGVGAGIGVGIGVEIIYENKQH
jgi:hypothetical protein